jgi:hypothetical protein
MIKLKDILNEKIDGSKVICDKCHWSWNISDGGNTPYTCHKCGNDNTPIGEDLRKWFGKGPTGGWDRYNTKGEKIGKCGDSEKGSAYAACLSNEKAAKLGKDGIAAFVKRKRAAQSKAGDSKKGGEQKKGQKPTFVKTGASEGLEEKWSQKYKNSINCSNPKGFSQKAHCAGKKKNEIMTIEEKMELFLEKNCPTDSAKWSASKAAAKRKFDVYPSAYANGWAAKNYKSKGGGWKVCKESVIKEVEVAAGHENDRDMVTGVAEILRMVDDMNNRKEIAEAMLRKFKSEDVIHNAGEFLTLCGISS